MCIEVFVFASAKSLNSNNKCNKGEKFNFKGVLLRANSIYPFSYPDLPDKPSNTVKCMQSEVHVVIEVHIESSRGMNKGKKGS